ncbi:SAF domain-containing protein [Amycolatopsis sp. NPDC049868]|uniref:SAF domain-containing protein n=1 Tax=Amycolatopsis sp. NPDC049868 TaxID=3363934 RepID=UPI0037A9D044
MTSTDSPARGHNATGEARPASWLDSSGSPSRTAARRGRRRRLPHLVAGVLLVVLCVGGAVWWTTSTQDRVPVLALAKPVPLGHVLTPADLRSIDVSAAPGVALIPADRAESVLGQPMATGLGAGALLTPDAVGAAAIPAVGRAVVAVVVKPGQAPPELAAGAPVTVVVTTTAGSSTGQSPGTSWRATVVRVAPVGTDQTTVVSLELDTAGASRLAQVPAGQLALVMQPAGGER